MIKYYRKLPYLLQGFLYPIYLIAVGYKFFNFVGILTSTNIKEYLENTL